MQHIDWKIIDFEEFLEQLREVADTSTRAEVDDEFSWSCALIFLQESNKLPEFFIALANLKFTGGEARIREKLTANKQCIRYQAWWELIAVRLVTWTVQKEDFIFGAASNNSTNFDFHSDGHRITQSCTNKLADLACLGSREQSLKKQMNESKKDGGFSINELCDVALAGSS